MAKKEGKEPNGKQNNQTKQGQASGATHCQNPQPAAQSGQQSAKQIKKQALKQSIFRAPKKPQAQTSAEIIEHDRKVEHERTVKNELVLLGHQQSAKEKLRTQDPSHRAMSLINFREFLCTCRDHTNSNGNLQQAKNTPLLTWEGKVAQEKASSGFTFNQIGIVGYRAKEAIPGPSETSSSDGSSDDILEEDLDECEIDPIFINTDTPWSAFICGSQGSGKSHTLSCLLENCLFDDQRIGALPKPLAGIVFHFDRQSRGDVCEAAYLASLGIPVRVLVSETNLDLLRAAYSKIPGIGNKIQVCPLLLRPQDLNVGRLQNLMAFDENGAVPLYMAKAQQVLREMAIRYKDGGVLTKDRYAQFKADLNRLELTTGQRGPLDLRLSLLESYMWPDQTSHLFKTHPGCLTIVDLTTPLITQADACSLFNICLELFLENSSDMAKVVALDEAHKYMSTGETSSVFTETLLTAIRLQRHAGVRLIISTQEPTVSPKLLDLCTMTFVHRFHSPEWFSALRGHVAGLSQFEADGNTAKEIFAKIVNLKVGESFLFAPTAVFDINEYGEAERVGSKATKMKTRLRLSADGGQSKTATG